MKTKKETITVESNAIKKASYDYDIRLLKITFVNGKKYNYHNVPTDTFISMKYSKSIGRFINKYIKSDFNYESI